MSIQEEQLDNTNGLQPGEIDMSSSADDSTLEQSQKDDDVIVKLPVRGDGHPLPAPRQLLDDIPSDRKITVAWKDVSASVPTFNAKESVVDKLKAIVPSQARNGHGESRKQVRIRTSPCVLVLRLDASMPVVQTAVHAWRRLLLDQHGCPLRDGTCTDRWPGFPFWAESNSLSCMTGDEWRCDDVSLDHFFCL